MQGLADGYFVIPYTLGHYLAGASLQKVDTSHDAFKKAESELREKTQKMLGIKGKRTVASFHRELGKLMWDKCGMARSAESLGDALKRIPALRAEFWENVTIPGSGDDLNQSLENAGRVADFLEFAELLCQDALTRDESCGGHFRVEHQTPDGEAKRDDERFCHASVWEHQGVGKQATLNKEPLVFENVKLTQRSYK